MDVHRGSCQQRLGDSLNPPDAHGAPGKRAQARPVIFVRRLHGWSNPTGWRGATA
jgi:hypothetical protein